MPVGTVQQELLIDHVWTDAKVLSIGRQTK